MSLTDRDDDRHGNIRDLSTMYSFEDHEYSYSLYISYILLLKQRLI